ncbi:cytochrome P450 [Mangrovimicrobium sediminis]|uniref:Cytochrome P450 n=1 Tax=Mangrovimicrobium sediminis TaxID=2562682 RepID=A0A4Z0M5Y8_9GAMM|nr:cytochrome P450 [Haliea sp. SAOS-164]TGD74856.1 cytochrome P450 [Haliea sp. SAOS-164]
MESATTEQPLAELQLPHLPLDSTDFAADPMRYILAARATHPWLATSDFGYVVHEYAAMKDLFRHEDGNMRVPLDGVADILDVRDTPWGRFMNEQVLNLHGPAHQQLRAIVAPMFTPRRANERRELMREKMRVLLDEWVPKGAFDFEEFASYYPISVMCALIGAPGEVIPKIRDSLEALGVALSMDPKTIPLFQRAMLLMDEFVIDLVARRRAGERTTAVADLLDALIEATGQGLMSERQLYDMLINLFVAGYDTSKNVMTLTMHALLQRPDVYAQCAEDLEYCKLVIEESLRYRSSTSLLRELTADVSYRDVLLPAGTLLWFTNPVIGRDPDAFPDPERFDPWRKDPNRHSAFGLGAHICLGQFIARAQIQEGFHLLAQRVRNPRQTGPVGYRPFMGAGGLKGLPIAFDPAPAG